MLNFLNRNFEPCPPFWAWWHEVVVKTRCKNAPIWTSVITPGCVSWKIGFFCFFKWGKQRNWQIPFFDWAGKLVIRGTNCWYFEHGNGDDDDNKNNRISKNWTDNFGGDDGGRNGGRSRGCAASRIVTTRTRAEERGDGDHCQGWAGILSVARGGRFFPAEAVVEDPPLWSGAPAQGIGE